jgi:Tfp pilus assembly protein PilF
VERALDPDPARRFATAGEMEVALANAAHPQLPGSSRARWTLAGIGLALSLLVVTLLLSQDDAQLTVNGRRISTVAIGSFTSAAPEAKPNQLLEGLALDVVRALQQFDVEVKRTTTGRPGVRAGTFVPGTADVWLRGEMREHEGRTSLQITASSVGGGDLWRRDYEASDPTLPTIARTIAADIAAAIGAQPRPGAPAPVAPPSFQAYEAYLRGRTLWEERTPTSLKRSLEYFKQSAALDPNYAEPWAGMADAYIALGVSAFGPLSPMEARRLTKEAALTALERNPGLAEAHTSLAFAAYFHDWDWAVAETRFQRAIELNPQYALAHHWYADYLTAMGRREDAMREIRRALELEPLSLIIHRDVAWHLFFQRRYDEAVDHLRETLAKDPNYTAARTLLARALAERGDHTEALRELAAVTSGMSGSAKLSVSAYVQALSGDTAGARSSLRTLESWTDGYVSPYNVALVYAALGDPHRAMEYLKQAHEQQDSTLVNVNADPRFDPIRNDARFQALLDQLRFPRDRR